MNEFEKTTKELCSFIESSPSCFHVIDNIGRMLEEQNFIRLSECERWNLKPGKSYYVSRNGSSIISFTLPASTPSCFRIIASHSDSPSFKIKENPEIPKAGHYVELNIEKYGGMLYAPWFDRPLGIAGRVSMIENGNIRQILIDTKQDLVMIPSLAIHMNRDANNGGHTSIQSDMLPIFGDETSSGEFMKMLAGIAGIPADNILGTDLFLYARTPFSIWGVNREFFSGPRLDDLQCAYSSVRAILDYNKKYSHTDIRPAYEKSDSPEQSAICICSIFDNEEVGSRTRQGADSSFLLDVLNRISSSLGQSLEEHLIMLSSSFMLSADNSHAVHPNHSDKADPVNRPYMNGGVVLKFNANQKYATDSISSAVFRAVCKEAGVPVQTYVNHSDIAGGSTLGNISSSHVSIHCADIGCAQLAMHSPYETAGVKDTLYMIRAMKAFYNSSVSFTN